MERFHRRGAHLRHDYVSIRVAYSRQEVPQGPPVLLLGNRGRGEPRVHEVEDAVRSGVLHAQYVAVARRPRQLGPDHPQPCLLQQPHYGLG